MVLKISPPRTATAANAIPHIMMSPAISASVSPRSLPTMSATAKIIATTMPNEKAIVVTTPYTVVRKRFILSILSQDEDRQYPCEQQHGQHQMPEDPNEGVSDGRIEVGFCDPDRDVKSQR